MEEIATKLSKPSNLTEALDVIDQLSLKVATLESQIQQEVKVTREVLSVTFEKENGKNVVRALVSYTKAGRTVQNWEIVTDKFTVETIEGVFNGS